MTKVRSNTAVKNVTLETMRKGVFLCNWQTTRAKTAEEFEGYILKQLRKDPSYGRYACEACCRDITNKVPACPWCSAEFLPEIQPRTTPLVEQEDSLGYADPQEIPQSAAKVKVGNKGGRPPKAKKEQTDLFSQSEHNGEIDDDEDVEYVDEDGNPCDAEGNPLPANPVVPSLKETQDAQNKTAERLAQVRLEMQKTTAPQPPNASPADVLRGGHNGLIPAYMQNDIMANGTNPKQEFSTEEKRKVEAALQKSSIHAKAVPGETAEQKKLRLSKFAEQVRKEMKNRDRDAKKKMIKETLPYKESDLRRMNRTGLLMTASVLGLKPALQSKPEVLIFYIVEAQKVLYPDTFTPENPNAQLPQDVLDSKLVQSSTTNETSEISDVSGLEDDLA